MGHRVFLAGLALGPAVAVVVAPSAPSLLPLTLALGGAGSAYALLSSLRTTTTEQAPRRTENALMRPDGLRDPSLDVPELAEMRTILKDALRPEVRLPDVVAPPSVEAAVGAALGRVLHLWNDASLDSLTRDEVVELFLFRRLLMSPADVAGDLSQLFHRPDMVLGIRDEIAAVRKRRASHDRQQAAFDATWRLWQSASQSGARGGLLMALQRLEAADPDLWHKVVLEHDPHDPEQRAAALWCVRQRSCDQATVAAYLAFLAADGHLQAAARRGDTVWLDAVLDVVEAWNAGSYKSQVLSLSPPDMLMSDAAIFTTELEALSLVTGQPRWPVPQGIFREYSGRPPRNRDNWCLKTGRMSSPPNHPDYIDWTEAA